MDIALPFGALQIHFAVAPVVEAIHHLQKVLREFNAQWESVFAENAGNPESLVKDVSNIAEGSINQKIKEASEKFEQSLVETHEYPHVLPRITRQLIYGSIVAQVLQLSFEVVDYELNNEGERSYWWVTGRIKDRHNRMDEREGTSFMFDPNDEKVVEGALLSACADAFIHCVHSVFPYFPWDRWNEAWNAGLTDI